MTRQRRSTAALALLLAALAAIFASATARADVDPVRLTITAPATAKTGTAVPVTVAVATDAGALDPRVGAIRVGVRLAPECGGSFATTPGPTIIDAALAPQPTAGAAYAATAKGSAVAPGSGTLTVCTFLTDGEGRQFATDGDSAVVVSPTGAVNPPDGSGLPGGGAGSAPTGTAGCTPTLTTPKTIRRRATLKLPFRACAKGTYRFQLLLLDKSRTRHLKGPRRTLKVKASGKLTEKFPLGALRAGRYRVVMVTPSGQHVHPRTALRVRAK